VDVFVQMNALGQVVSRLLRASARERHTLIAAGAGAGLAAAFNAPHAGVIFVLEELHRDFAPGALTGAFVASVTADVVERLLMGQSPVFHVASPPVPPLSSLPLFLALGLFAGLLGVAFNRALLASLRLFERTAAWLGVTGAWSTAIGARGAAHRLRYTRRGHRAALPSHVLRPG
jgi:CIC family chloride channel protein